MVAAEGSPEEKTLPILLRTLAFIHSTILALLYAKPYVRGENPPFLQVPPQRVSSVTNIFLSDCDFLSC